MAIFGGKVEAPPRPSSSRPESESIGSPSRLGRGVLVDGTISGSEPLVIEGDVRGKVDLESDLKIGRTARIHATVHGNNVTVEGTVKGDLSADHRVELVATANVEGNIRAPKIVVAEGARFQGSIDMNAARPEGKASHPARKDSEDKSHASSR